MKRNDYRPLYATLAHSHTCLNLLERHGFEPRHTGGLHSADESVGGVQALQTLQVQGIRHYCYLTTELINQFYKLFVKYYCKNNKLNQTIATNHSRKQGYSI